MATPRALERTSQTILVTADNFVRAESDWYLGNFVKRSGLGKLAHLRELRPIEIGGVRPNRDTLYSQAVFDLDAGPVTMTLPDPGARFMAMQVIDQDHYSGRRQQRRGTSSTRPGYRAVQPAVTR